MIRSLLLALLSTTALTYAQKEVTFKARDGLPVTADLYAPHADKKTPFIVLFHQAQFSRGAYREIAPKLNKLGFNCLAIDARSGASARGVKNLTAERAQRAGLGLQYRDALPDLEAAVDYAGLTGAKGKVILWGSSYSASLVFEIAGSKPNKVHGVISFSPNFPKYPGARKAISKMKIPFFVTSARAEVDRWKSDVDASPSKTKIAFVPKGKGRHGARALWEEEEDHAEYWLALTSFLNRNFSKKKQGNWHGRNRKEPPTHSISLPTHPVKAIPPPRTRLTFSLISFQLST